MPSRTFYTGLFTLHELGTCCPVAQLKHNLPSAKYFLRSSGDEILSHYVAL